MTKLPLPIVLSRPHGGLGVPQEIIDKLAIDEIALYNECDLWVDKLFDFNHKDLEPMSPSTYGPGILAAISMPIARGLIDVNRPLRMLGEPDGPVKTRTSYGEQIYHEPLSDEMNQQLVETYWQDYHNCINTALTDNHGNVELFIDCHNMAQHGPTKYRDAGKPRPLICITNLGDADGNPRPEHGWTFASREFSKKAVETAWELFEDMDLLEPTSSTPPPVALLNQPFWGSYVVVEHFSPEKQRDNYEDHGIKPPKCIMIEVNRGLYVGNQTQSTTIEEPNEERISQIRHRLFQWAIELLKFDNDPS